jgi:hypothetical protein
VIAGGGPDVEDGAATAGHHLLHSARGQVDDGLDVHAHLRYLVGNRGLRHRADGADTRIVDEDVDGQSAGGDGVEKACASVGVGDVTGDGLDAHGVPELGGELLQPVFATGDQRHAVATLCQLTRDVRADARGGAGDDGGVGG